MIKELQTRAGTRFGPRQIRTESILVKELSKQGDGSLASYETLKVGDMGDVYLTMYDVKQAARRTSRNSSRRYLPLDARY